jgi:AcrR family transcriptional regulator
MKKSEQQRQNIIDVGRRLFAQQGYAGTSTRQIKEQAGIAEGLLYYYFPQGKRQLLDAIVHEGVDQRMRVANALLDDWDNTHIEEHMMALFDGITQVVQDEVGYQSLLITVRERQLLSDEQSAWLIQAFDGVQTRLTTALQNLETNRRPADLATLAQTLMSLSVKALFEELLLRNHRYLSAATRDQVAQQVHLVLQVL